MPAFNDIPNIHVYAHACVETAPWSPTHKTVAFILSMLYRGLARLGDMHIIRDAASRWAPAYGQMPVGSLTEASCQVAKSAADIADMVLLATRRGIEL